MSYETELRQILRRLGESSGRRTARRNALRDLDTLLRRIRRELRRDYPMIDKDGQEIRREMLPKGARRCPADGAYVPTAADFAEHVMSKHGGKCWCEYRPRIMIVVRKLARGGVEKNRVFYDPAAHVNRADIRSKAQSSLRAHFDRNKDQLAEHVTLGAIGQISSPQSGDTNP